MPDKCYRKHISVLDEVIREKKNEKEKEGNCIIIKESGNEDSINSWLNSPHKKGLGNLTKMIHNKLHSETHIDKLLNRGPPLQDPLGGDDANKAMLNVVHHAPPH